MLVAAINAVDYQNTQLQIQQAMKLADAVELRLDYWSELNFETIAQLKNEFSIPMIFTLRQKAQGGHYTHSEDQRLKDIIKLCHLQPDYLDVEFGLSIAFLKQIHEQFPAIKLICSYHDFDQTPLNLKVLLDKMQNKYCHSYKIAAKANCAQDTLRMLIFIREMSLKCKITGICMGEFGTATRILGPVIGNELTYASVNAAMETAPGQCTLEELCHIYHFHELNPETKVYALLGDPVDRSVGHLWHNQAMQLLGKNAVYIKMRVIADEILPVMQCFRQLPFYGFSVTMPLKEVVKPAIDEIDNDAQHIGAINTIVVEDGKYNGFNTDGLGAIHALQTQLPSLSQKTIIVLGAGGSARAIIYTAIQNGAKVIIFNRSLEKAQQLAAEFSCVAYDLTQTHLIQDISYSIIINTLPYSVQNHQLFFINKEYFRPHTIAMDIVYNPVKTPFLEMAEQAGCVGIPGYYMFNEQALLQAQYWYALASTQLKELHKPMEKLAGAIPAR